jgi:hypothetical protein
VAGAARSSHNAKQLQHGRTAPASLGAVSHLETRLENHLENRLEICQLLHSNKAA